MVVAAGKLIFLASKEKELFIELNLPHTQPHCECQGTRLHPSLSQKRLYLHLHTHVLNQFPDTYIHVLNTHTHIYSEYLV